MNTPRPISLRELAFVRDVLIPRVWVRGSEVDELLRVRSTIDLVFLSVQGHVPAATCEPAAQPEGPGTPDGS